MMKLLFDENLSPSLAVRLADIFPGSTHVHNQALGAASDPEVWEFAKQHAFVIASKDSDYVDMAMGKGPPPKVISIALGNCTTGQVESLLRIRQPDITAFGENAEDAVLILP